MVILVLEEHLGLMVLLASPDHRVGLVAGVEMVIQVYREDLG